MVGEYRVGKNVTFAALNYKNRQYEEKYKDLVSDCWYRTHCIRCGLPVQTYGNFVRKCLAVRLYYFDVGFVYLDFYF